VMARARWVMLRARWVTLRARWVTLRARRVSLSACWVMFSGTLMGETAVLYPCKRAATVRADTASVLWTLSRDAFTRVVHAHQVHTPPTHPVSRRMRENVT
jgi:CRP-like cAMP-binding protein